MNDEVSASGAKRSRVIAKQAKYEQFKKEQRLHPEYAGVYAEAFLTDKEMHHYQELRVFWQVHTHITTKPAIPPPSQSRRRRRASLSAL